MTGRGEMRDALARRVDNLIRVDGEIHFPAVPAMREDFTDKCVHTFAEAGRTFNAEERAHLAAILGRALTEAYAFSQRSSVTVAYRSRSAGPLDYRVTTNCVTLEEAYDEWVAQREPPLFGSLPDARVWALAAEVADPKGCRVLDIGAGTGRNTLALARRGHPVDAAELTAAFADAIESDARREGLDVTVVRRDVFDSEAGLREDYSLILLSGVVSEFRTAEHLRAMFGLAARSLRPGGTLIFNTFLARDGAVLDDAARQFAEFSYSSFFTRAEMASAVRGLPLEPVADDSVYEYEKANLPDGAWPPTNWYENWVTGRDVFGLDRERSPIESRWLVYRKTD